MTDKEAAELAKGSFDLDEKKTDLKRKYFKKFQKVMPATKAARFFQIENQLNMGLELMRDVQAAGAVGMRVKEDKAKGSTAVLFFRRDDVPADLVAKEAEIRRQPEAALDHHPGAMNCNAKP